MDKLHLIHSFLVVARTENFTRAAEQLRVSPQAVSAQISQLEKWLGVRLFHRTTRRVALTDDGRLFFQRCQHGMQWIEQGERELRDRHDEAQGVVRIVASVSLGQVLVRPLLARFARQYPELRFEFSTHYHWPEVVEQTLDIGVAGGVLTQSSIVARRAGTFTHLLCAAPSYLAAHGVPANPESLRDHRCIGLAHPRTGRIWPWTFERQRRSFTLEPPLSLLTQDPVIQRDWVLDGLGIAQIPDYFAAPHLEAGRLQEVRVGYRGPRIDIHLFMPQREYVPKRSRLVYDFLLEGLSAVLDRKGM
ncbi:MAG: LysR substrate-binding domain-containing protein [Pigmentiphaga sp.]|nr:LysR substrate-binding domain-containing protein [Pigmentiphaga sp.]